MTSEKRKVDVGAVIVAAIYLAVVIAALIIFRIGCEGFIENAPSKVLPVSDIQTEQHKEKIDYETIRADNGESK